MGHSILKWIADDGTEYESAREMILHELDILDGQEIDIYLTTITAADRRKAEYRKVLVGWQTYKNQQKADEMQRHPKLAPQSMQASLPIDPVVDEIDPGAPLQASATTTYTNTGTKTEEEEVDESFARASSL